MKRILPSIYAPLLLSLIAILICALNYIPGTYLSGWDTIHPEFYFQDYFKRVFSMWQEHQGLGAVASQAHAAELPRLLIYYLYSFIFPESFLRYLYFFICLVVGPLGVFYFSRQIVSQKISYFAREVISFLTGLLYLLNLTTLQQFSVPLEMFATHYALLGWTFLFAWNYFLKAKRTSLFWFSIVTFFSSPMAHTSTLFYSFFLVFSLFCFVFWLLQKFPFRRLFVVLSVTLLLNLYWLLPNVYYVLHYADSVANSKIHYQFSDRAYQIGTNFGNIRDTALLRNFLFDWGQYDVKEGTFSYLLSIWDKHFGVFTSIIGIGVFGLVLLGMVKSIWQKNKLAIAFLPVFLIPYFFINNDNVVFRILNDFLSHHVVVLKESLRFPYTKFSILLLFSYCVYFSLALGYVIPFITNLKFKTKRISEKAVTGIMGILISCLLVYFMLPAFSGNLISDNVKVKIPDEYFQLFDYFRSKDPNARIAEFPVHTFWGWYYYDWGFEGAGFSWFGLAQPLLDREFDRWHPANENYYWEISYATYSQNLQLLENVLEKYKVSYLVVDTHVLDASSTKSPYLNKLDDLIGDSKKIHLERTIGGLTVYKFDLQESNSVISVQNELPGIGPEYVKNNNDQAYTDYGEYISLDENESKNADVYYPFRSLFSNRSPEQSEFIVEESEDFFYFKKTLPIDISGYELERPDFSAQQLVWYGPDNLDQSGSIVPIVSVSESTIVIKLPKVKNYFSAEIDAGRSEVVGVQKNCDFLGAKKEQSGMSVENKVIEEGSRKLLQIRSLLANNCGTQFMLPNLSHNLSYLISVENENVKNKSLLFWLENLNQKKVDIESYLPQSVGLKKSYFVQPPMEEFGRGYTLHFDNWSFNKTETVNNLGKISMYPIPYDYLRQIYFKKKDLTLNKNTDGCEPNVVKHTPYWFSVQLDQKNCVGSKTIVLNESYDDGWMAFDPSRKTLEKVKVSNWSNGFKMGESQSGKIELFFVPQLLQFFGYVIFVITFAIISSRFIKRKR